MQMSLQSERQIKEYNIVCHYFWEIHLIFEWEKFLCQTPIIVTAIFFNGFVTVMNAE